MRADLLWFGALLLLLLLIAVAFVPVAPGNPFAYDEADYMFAGTRGLLANFLDRPSQSLVEFITKGRELTQNGQARSMSEYIRSTGDITFYRHYHGPVFAYWIAVLQSIGISSEHGYRGAGLFLHSAGAIMLFWLFRLAFPQLGPFAAFTAAAVFATNRTALVTATSITQHLVFAFFTGLSLLLLALYIRTRTLYWWYATAAFLAVAFASVEISVILIGCVVLTLLIIHWRDGWRQILLLIGKGAVAFLVTLTVVWPRGVLTLGALKGFLYLAYMTLYRKTFTPIGPFDLWGFKLKTYPLEFVPLLIALVAATVFWPRFKSRNEMLPFLLYGWAFVAATMVITLPYTYYHCSLPMCVAVVTGILCGELGRRAGAAAAASVLAALLICGVLSAAGFRREKLNERLTLSTPARVLQYVRTRAGLGSIVYAPSVLIPTLHYYLPAEKLIGFDLNAHLPEIAAQAADAVPGAEVVCEQRACMAFEQQWPAVLRVQKQEIGRMRDSGEIMWAYQLHR